MVLHEFGKLIADTHTGAMADKYGVHKIMAIGLIIKSVGIIFWVLNTNLLFYFIGMLLLGIGRSCTAGGKIETYTYNMLFSLKKEHMFQDIWLGMLMVDGLAATLSGWLAGFLYEVGGVNLGLIFSVFIILVIHAPFVLFIMPNPQISIRKISAKLSIHNIIKDALKLIKHNNSILLLIIGMAIVPSFFIMLGKFKLFICNDIGMPIKQIANIDSMSHFLQFLCTPILLILFKKYKYQMTFLNNLYVIFLSLLILIIANFWYKMSTIYAIMFFIAIYPTISSSIKYSLEKTIPNEIRATVFLTLYFY
jgi:MFS family permease